MCIRDRQNGHHRFEHRVLVDFQRPGDQQERRPDEHNGMNQRDQSGFLQGQGVADKSQWNIGQNHGGQGVAGGHHDVPESAFPVHQSGQAIADHTPQGERCV